MKKFIVILLAILPFVIKATTYTSVSGGGNWSNSATWSPAGVPGSGDIVYIASPVTLDANESCDNLIINSSQTFNGSSNTLTVYGSFTNSGTFTYATSTIIFGGSGNQTITGATTFYNLTIDPSGSTDTTFLASAITVDNNLAISQGVFALESHAVTGNTTGTVTMASGTTMLCGSKTSTAQIDFPSNYTAAHISLNSNSTVVYQANNTTSGQAVSGIPAYGNLTITTSGATVVSGTILTVNGNFSLASNLNFNENIGTFDMYGNFLINSGAKFNFNGTHAYFSGNFTNYGTFFDYGNTVFFNGTSNQTMSGNNIAMNARFNGITYNPSSSSDTLFINCSLYCYAAIGMDNGKIVIPATCADTILQAGSLNVGTFTALGGVFYWEGGGANSGTITFNKLTVGNSGTVVLDGATSCSVNSDCTILSGSTFSLGSYTLTLNGNLTNNGTLTASTSTVKFDGSQNQTISGTGSLSFYNLTQNQAANTDSLFLGKAITVSHNLTVSEGVLDCQTNQITGNASGTFSLAANTGLVLGLTSSSTAVSFPYKFTSAHNSLNATSTVNYQANANQTISDTATYGNLILNTGASGVNKTPNGSITLAGTLTIDNGVTLPMSSNNLTVAKNFTDNGTFTYGTGTVTFNGSANQNLNGTSTTNFYNLTENTGASTDTLFLNNPITVNNTLTITQGILDCQKNQLTNSATPVVSLSPSSASICYGNSATLTASNYTNYLWYPSAGLSVTTGSSVSASPTSTTTYSVYSVTSNKYTCGVGTDVVTESYCPGVNCVSSIRLANDSCSTGSLSNSVNWFSFTATQTFINIVLSSHPNLSNSFVTNFTFYSGSCGSLDSLAYDTLAPDMGDTMLVFSQDGLTIGTTYYVKTITNTTSSNNFTCCLRQIDRNTSACSSSGPCDFIQNGGFEQYTALPNAASEVTSYLCYWINPEPGLETPDYYNTNTGGYSPPSFAAATPPIYAGNGCTGIFIADGYPPSRDYHEYIEEPLATPLTAGVVYQASMYVAPNQGMNASDRLCMYFSVHGTDNTTYYAHSSNTPLTFASGGYITPQVQSPIGSPITGSGWTLVTGTFTAVGGESYVTIGNFFPAFPTGSSMTDVVPTNAPLAPYPLAYYYIDGVSVTEVITVTMSSTSTCSGTSNGTATASVSGGVSPYTYSWAPGGSTNSTATGLSAGTYTVTVTDFTGCTATNTVVVSAIPSPTITVTPSAPIVCIGSSTSLIASGASTYTWSPGTALSSTTGASVTASPTVTITYTVTGTATNGCQTTASVVVTSAPIPSLLSSPISICSGGAAQLNPGCKFPLLCSDAYSWSGGLVGSDPTVSPTSTTTYSYTVTSLLGGCTNTGTITVDVNSTPTLTVTGPDLQCASGTLTYSVTGASSYTWSAVNGTLSTTSGASTVATWSSTTSGGDIICTGTSGSCNAIDTFEVGGCCDENYQCFSPTDCEYFQFNDETASNLESTYGTATFTGAGAPVGVDQYAININGTFTVDANIEFVNLNIYMGANAKIVFANGSKLDFEGCHLHACDEMWDGIYVDATTANNTLTVNQSLVEDAKNAIVSISGGEYTVTSSTLNKNYVGIKVEPYSSGTHPGTITTSTISCDNATFSYYSSYTTTLSGATTLIAPHTGKRTIYGMTITGVSSSGGIAVGASGSGNTFQDMDCGIYSTQSNVTVTSDNFTNMTKSASANSAAFFTGVYSNGGSSIYDLTVGGSSGTACTFTSCTTGIWALNNMEASISNNSIGGDGTTKSIGINFQADEEVTSYITYNTISNIQTGINCFKNLGAAGTHNTNIYITNNTISSVSGLTTSYGMYINEVYDPYTYYRIGYNTNIHNVTTGIYAANLQSSHIYHNVVTLNGLNPTVNEGIVSNATRNSNITYNDAIGTTTTNQDGIRMNQSILSNNVTCNFTNTTDNGLMFFGPQAAIRVDQNSMYNYNTAGMYLYSSGCTLGSQKSAAIPTGNYWQTCTGTPFATLTANKANNPATTTFYVPSPCNNDPGNNAFKTGAHLVTFSVTTGSARACPAFLMSDGADSSGSVVPPVLSLSDALQLLNISDSASFPQTTHWMKKYDLYVYLTEQDSSLADSSTVIKHFLDSARDGNIGIIEDINSDIYPGLGIAPNISGALAQNAGMVAPDTAETTYQSVYGVFLTMLANGETEPDSMSITVLKPIAEECPAQYGTAVYVARALLSNVDTNYYTNTCEAIPGGGDRAIRPTRNGNDNSNSTITYSTKVYPNPANSLLHVETNLPIGLVEHICIYSSTGQLVECTDLNTNITTINIANLQSGIYYYRITDNNGGLIRADKLMIVH